MFKSTVSCWFCNEESYVYFFKKNSWNCENCGQYNGFNKDGDYNKPMPEMQNATNKKFCHTNGQQAVSSNNFLCEKCNNYQELKLLELKNFESKADDKSEEEYNLYRKKLDQIYDLCVTCKQKLNIHLRKQDQQIGNYLEKNLKKRKTSQLPETLKLSQNEKSANQINLDDLKLAAANSINDSVYSSHSSNVKKAHTIAGSVPPQMLINGNHHKKEIYMNGTNIMNGKHAHHSQDNNNNNHKNIINSNKLINNNSSNVKIKEKITTGSLGIILEDMIVFVLSVLVFICDIVNLVNDSDLWNDEQSFFKSDDFTWFHFFLTIYKHITTILVVNLVLSLHGIYKRPKISRFLTMIGFVFSGIVHLHWLGFILEEQFIFEVFISFFLTSYLLIARTYNLFQCVRYFGIM